MSRVKLLGNVVRFDLRRATWLPLQINVGYYTRLKDRSWKHGDAADPSKWPWWKLFHVSLLRLPSVHKPSTGYRLWVYGLRNARCLDVDCDRRDLRAIS